MLTAFLVSATIWADDKIYSIRTNSLTCDFCAYDLEQKFLQMKGVKDFEVDLGGILFVKTDLSLKLDESFVKKLLLDNGFDYKGMTEKIE
ncbi:MAG: hypothetical protein ACC657_11665 [Thiohalomonadales bacterium]